MRRRSLRLAGSSTPSMVASARSRAVEVAARKRAVEVRDREPDRDVRLGMAPHEIARLRLDPLELQAVLAAGGHANAKRQPAPEPVRRQFGSAHERLDQRIDAIAALALFSRLGVEQHETRRGEAQIDVELELEQAEDALDAVLANGSAGANMSRPASRPACANKLRRGRRSEAIRRAGRRARRYARESRESHHAWPVTSERRGAQRSAGRSAFEPNASCAAASVCSAWNRPRWDSSSPWARSAPPAGAERRIEAARTRSGQLTAGGNARVGRDGRRVQ